MVRRKEFFRGVLATRIIFVPAKGVPAGKKRMVLNLDCGHERTCDPRPIPKFALCAECAKGRLTSDVHISADGRPQNRKAVSDPLQVQLSR